MRRARRCCSALNQPQAAPGFLSTSHGQTGKSPLLAPSAPSAALVSPMVAPVTFSHPPASSRPTAATVLAVFETSPASSHVAARPPRPYTRPNIAPDPDGGSAGDDAGTNRPLPLTRRHVHHCSPLEAPSTVRMNSQQWRRWVAKNISILLLASPYLTNQEIPSLFYAPMDAGFRCTASARYFY